MIIFQKDGSQVLEKDFAGPHNCQEAGRRFASQRSHERIYNEKIPKVNALSKDRSGAYSPKFIQVEVNFQAWS